MTPEGSLGVVHRSHRPARRPVEWIQLSREFLPGWQYGAETQWLTSDEYTTEQAALKCFDLVARSLDSAGVEGRWAIRYREPNRRCLEEVHRAPQRCAARSGTFIC